MLWFQWQLETKTYSLGFEMIFQSHLEFIRLGFQRGKHYTFHQIIEELDKTNQTVKLKQHFTEILWQFSFMCYIDSKRVGSNREFASIKNESETIGQYVTHTWHMTHTWHTHDTWYTWHTWHVTHVAHTWHMTTRATHMTRDICDTHITRDNTCHTHVCQCELDLGQDCGPCQFK